MRSLGAFIYAINPIRQWRISYFLWSRRRDVLPVFVDHCIAQRLWSYLPAPGKLRESAYRPLHHIDPGQPYLGFSQSTVVDIGAFARCHSLIGVVGEMGKGMGRALAGSQWV